MHSKNTVYRPDIDGLRAIAVLSVVIFHAFPSILNGGFIGVDIFFVISGYLISRILFSNLDNDKFSLLDFYSRRINRIYPALILVLITCLTFGWISLLADEYMQLGKHTAGGAGFVANLVFWSETGYFDNLSDTKPLLHLWSLGIEEQFYIIWPILLLAIWKSKINRLSIIIILASASFLIGLITIKIDSSAAFYSPQSRFWELLIGSIIAYFSMYRPATIFSHRLLTYNIFAKYIYRNQNTQPLEILRNAQSILGILMIMAGIFFITKESLFPGYWALLPTVGTALIISAGPNALINKHLLSNKIMVWIGLISFPLYLWHWPILSFIRIIEADTPSAQIRISALAASILLAWATYALIENPLRLNVKRKSKTAILFLLMLATGLSGYLIYKEQGVSDRQVRKNLINKSNDLNKYEIASCLDKNIKYKEMSWCNKIDNNKDEEYILWGDSHAEHLFPGLKSVKNKNWLLIGRNSCPPILGVKAWVSNKSKYECEIANNNSIDLIKSSNAKIVVLASLGGVYLSDKGVAPEHKGINDNNPNSRYIIGETNDVSNKKALFAEGLKKSVQELISSGKKVVLVKDTPEFLISPRACATRPFKISKPDCSISRSSFEGRNKQYDDILQDIASVSKNVQIFDASSLFCDKTKCYSSDNSDIFFRDGHHLSNSGSKIVATKLTEFIDHKFK